MPPANLVLWRKNERWIKRAKGLPPGHCLKETLLNLRDNGEKVPPPPAPVRKVRVRKRAPEYKRCLRPSPSGPICRQCLEVLTKPPPSNGECKVYYVRKRAGRSEKCRICQIRFQRHLVRNNNKGRSCSSCGTLDPVSFSVVAGICGNCTTARSSALRRTHLSLQASGVYIENIDDELVLRWAKVWSETAPPAYKPLNLSVSLSPPGLGLRRECARELYAERARVGQFFRSFVKYKSAGLAPLCHCGVPVHAGHFRRCVFTRDEVGSVSVLKSPWAWRDLWAVKKRKVDSLRALEKQGFWLEVDPIRGRVLVDNSVLIGGFGADTQRVQDSPLLKDGCT